MEISDLFSKNFKRIRAEKALTQAFLARSVNVSTQTVRDIEAGRRNPSFELVGKLAQKLGITVGDLFLEEKEDRSNVHALPVSEAIKKLMAIPDNIYDLAQDIPKDDQCWDAVRIALKGAQLRINKLDNSKKSI